MTYMACPGCGTPRRDDGWDAPGKLGEYFPRCNSCQHPSFVWVTTDDMVIIYNEAMERHAQRIEVTALEFAGIKAWSDRQERERERRSTLGLEYVNHEYLLYSIHPAMFGLPIMVVDPPAQV